MSTSTRSRALMFACAAAAQTIPAQTLPPTERLRALLRELDTACNTAGVDAYLGRFSPDDRRLLEVHGRQLRQRAAGGRTLVRQSEPEGARRCGKQIVVAVRCTTTDAAHPAQPPLHERGYLVVAERGSELVPVLAVELPADGRHCTADDTFKCSACNYAIGGVDGWLCVPVAGERSAAVEGSTFLLLGTDLALDVSVQVGDGDCTAAAVASALAEELREGAGGVAGMTEPWQPPGCALPAAASGARTTVRFADGQRAVLHATVLGSLRHLLLLRGSGAAIDRCQKEIAALLGSYHLLQTDASLVEQAATALAAHTGGTLDADGGYVNPRHAVAARGPQGWTARLLCAGAAFQVLWSCPAGGRLWLAGHRPPGGIVWTEARADRWLADLVARAGLVVEKDSAWSSAGATGERERVLHARVAATGASRFLRLLLRDDLLVVADGVAAAGADPAPLQQALESVRRP